MFLLDTAYAMGGSPQGGQTGGTEAMLMQLLPLVLIFVIFYFLLIRPQQKKAKDHKQMLENIKKGDKVITSGGIYGVVEATGTNTVTLKIAENVRVKVGKGNIAAIRSASEED